jgi:hypothetical protein
MKPIGLILPAVLLGVPAIGRQKPPVTLSPTPTKPEQERIIIARAIADPNLRLAGLE